MVGFLQDMTKIHMSLSSDTELLEEVRRLAAGQRTATARLVRSLMELDARRLYLAEGFSSLFAYCTQALRLSEHAAYGCIEAARAARRFPAVLDLLEDGSITVTTVTLVAAHLTPENTAQVLASARHRSKRDVEQIEARFRPLPDVTASVRKLPAPAAAPLPPPVAQITTTGYPADGTRNSSRDTWQAENLRSLRPLRDQTTLLSRLPMQHLQVLQVPLADGDVVGVLELQLARHAPHLVVFRGQDG